MVSGVTDVVKQGPEAVTNQFAEQQRHRTLDDMDLKLLADLSWTRANTLAESNSAEAVRWARAALSGYEFLQHNASTAIAHSASEDVELLRSWPLLRTEA